MDSQKETSVIVCKHCQQTKVRTFANFYPNKKDKKWIDAETGREFNGRLCPPCDSEKKARNQRLKRRIARIKSEAEYDNNSTNDSSSDE